MGRSIEDRARDKPPTDPDRFSDWSEQIKPDQKLEMAGVSGHGFLLISKIELEPVVVEKGKEANKVPPVVVEKGKEANKVPPVVVEKGKEENKVPPVVVEKGKEANKVPVIVTFDGYKCVIGTLSESAPESSFDIAIYAKRFQFYHEWKERSVKISGYYYDKPVMTPETDDEEDSMLGYGFVDEEVEEKEDVEIEECVYEDVFEQSETDEEDSMDYISADNEAVESTPNHLVLTRK